MAKNLSILLKDGKFNILTFPKPPKKGTKAYETYMNEVIEVDIKEELGYFGAGGGPSQKKKMTRKEYSVYCKKHNMGIFVDSKALAKYLSDKKKYEKISSAESRITFP
ncbi:MAG: hypothetical protein WC475_02975 [Candidatus Paceibacterota bacterium]